MVRNEIQEAVDVANFKKDIDFIKDYLRRIETLLQTDYAKKSEVAAVSKDVSLLQKIVFTAISVITLAVLYAFIAQVIKPAHP